MKELKFIVDALVFLLEDHARMTHSPDRQDAASAHADNLKSVMKTAAGDEDDDDDEDHADLLSVNAMGAEQFEAMGAEQFEAKLDAQMRVLAEAQRTGQPATSAAAVADALSNDSLLPAGFTEIK